MSATVTMPRFANSPNPATAKYAIRYGKPVDWVDNKMLLATCDGVSTDVSGRMTDAQKVALAVAMTEWAAELGLREQSHGWEDERGRRYREIRITSDGRFIAEGKLGQDYRTIKATDAARVARMLSAAANEGEV